MKKKVLATILATAMTLSMVGCGAKAADEAPAESAATEEAAAEEEAVEEVAAAADGKIAVILKTQATDFWVKMGDGVKEYCDANGIEMDFYAATADTDYEGQLAILEQCVNSGEYAGIAIAPCSGVNMIQGVKAANDAGITIVNIDEQFDEAEMTAQGATCVAYISSDNESIGYMGAEYLCTLIDEGSEVGVVEGIAGNASSEARAAGAKAAFTEKGMNIVADKACDWDMQTALDAVAAWLTQYPNLKAIYCCNDGMAAGVRQAVANAGKTGEVLVCGTDGDADAIEAVEAGNMTATVAQDPAGIGVKSVEILMDALANPDSYTPSAAPEKTPVDAILVK
ncbi:MAG: substrate-binding domain-containing protein [Lachnospiraceae bacterium]|nr:substrate-binding domain-containing protein [Lachnospiraceae bacterium]